MSYLTYEEFLQSYPAFADITMEEFNNSVLVSNTAYSNFDSLTSIEEKAVALGLAIADYFSQKQLVKRYKSRYDEVEYYDQGQAESKYKVLLNQILANSAALPSIIGYGYTY